MTDKPPETSRPDPLRREPPTLDLKAKDISAKGAKPDQPKSGSVPSTRSAGGKEETAATGSAGATRPAPTTPAQPASSTARPIPAEAIPTGRRPNMAGSDAVPASAGAAGAPSSTPASAASSLKTAAPEPTRGSAAAAERPDRGPGIGFGRLAATSLLGGLVGAGLALGAERYLESQGLDPRAKATDTRLATLEQRIGATQAGTAQAPGTANADLERRLAALENANKGLADSIGAVRAAADAARQAPANRGGEGLAARAVAEPDPALRDAVAGLTTRLDAIQDGARQSGAATQANAGAITELRTQLADLRTSLDNQTKQSTATAQTNAATLSELNARVAAAQSQGAERAQAEAGALQAMQGRLNDDEKRLATLSDQLTKFGPEAAKAGLRVIVAGQLTDTLHANAPLGPVLATLQKIGVAPAALEPLRPYAETAPPSSAVLARDFDPLAGRMIEAARGPATSIGDRLLRMADKIVTVRNVGDTGGADVADQVGRIEQALSRGAFGEAASAWDGLPDSAKRLSADWAMRLKQRADAEEAARRLSAEALSTIDAALR